MDRQRIDLFAAHREHGRKYGRKRPRRTSRESHIGLPWEKHSPHGREYVSFPDIEAFYVAFLGDEGWGDLGAWLKEAIATELGEGRLALRTWDMRCEVARVTGETHLSGRDAQRARYYLNRRSSANGEAFPFSACVFRRPADPLHHGTLTFTRGLHMGSPGRTHCVTDWPRPVPLVLGGPSEPGASAELLCIAGAAAVWNGTRLWLLRQVEDRFPSVLETLGLRGPRGRSPFTNQHQRR